MKKSLLLSLTFLLTSSLFISAGLSSKAKKIAIKGTTNLKAETLLILNEITDEKLIAVDSAIVSEKLEFKFELEGYDEATLFYITVGKQTPPGIPVIVADGDKVTMEISSEANTYDYTISGGKFNESMNKLHKIYTSHDRKMVAFNQEVARLDPASVTDSLRQATNERFNTLNNERTADISDFILNEPASPATYFAVKYLFQKRIPKLVVFGYERMVQEIPESKYTAMLKGEADRLGPTVEGRIAPDIMLPTPEGDSLALSSLRGQVVLIDFWASWCGPCRRENPHVKKLYEKYKDKGFEIYGVSLDRDAEKWVGAIAQDGLPWHHVSDLRGWSSAAGRAYGVSSIPQTFLIDAEGRILKSGLRGKELEKVLEELLM